MILKIWSLLKVERKNVFKIYVLVIELKSNARQLGAVSLLWLVEGDNEGHVCNELQKISSLEKLAILSS